MNRGKMKLLVGVIHWEEFVDDVDSLLIQRFPNGIESLMLEVPLNWQQVERYYRIPKFFLELAGRYKERGTKIVYGDAPIDLSKGITRLTLFNFYFSHKRDKSMVKNVEKENPQVAVVGKRHANYIKRRFPEVPYVAFGLVIPTKLEAIIYKLLERTYKPNQVINLVPRLPLEYYFNE